jgi:hypothetical protein
MMGCDFITFSISRIYIWSEECRHMVPNVLLSEWPTTDDSDFACLSPVNSSGLLTRVRDTSAYSIASPSNVKFFHPETLMQNSWTAGTCNPMKKGRSLSIEATASAELFVGSFQTLSRRKATISSRRSIYAIFSRLVKQLTLLARSTDVQRGGYEHGILCA